MFVGDVYARRWRLPLVSGLLAAMAGAGALGPITFEEISGRARVIFVSNASPTPEKHQPKPLVTGVAVFDYDGDRSETKTDPGGLVAPGP
jgi:hypothetical protein